MLRSTIFSLLPAALSLVVSLGVGVVPASAATTFRAAAVQHFPAGSYTEAPGSVVRQNLELYGAYVRQANENGADLVVFPEAGLGWLFAEVSSNTRAGMRPFCEAVTPWLGGAAPCEDPRAPVALRTLSCLAAKHALTIVYNHCELDEENGKQYNANIALAGRSGQVVARYRKAHLFGGAAVFDQAEPVATFFTLQFAGGGGGARIGLFICFDIEYDAPAGWLVQQLGVRHFAYSSWWVNTPPLLNSVEVQQAFSRLHGGVAVVAANTGSSPNGSGGGIFVAGDTLAMRFTTTRQELREVLYADVPVDLRRNEGVRPRALSFVSDITPVAEIGPTASASGTAEALRCSLAGFNGATCVLLPKPRAGAEAIAWSARLSSGSINCSVDAIASLAETAVGGKRERYAAVALQASRMWPDTPDTFIVEACMLVRCDIVSVAAESGKLTCTSGYSVPSHRLSALRVSSAFSADAVVFPVAGQSPRRAMSSFLPGVALFSPDELPFVSNRVVGSGRQSCQLSLVSNKGPTEALPVLNAGMWGVRPGRNRA